ncbi:MAG: dienelactone hydrolase family protein [Actinomycetes bacterium]
MLEGFEETRFTDDGVTHPVFVAGTGPAVIVMHEIPGITPEVASFARRIVDEGFRVYMPSMFGTPGKAMSNVYAGQQMIRASCISREFSVLAKRGSSPITSWLRALSRHAFEECGGPGVGAIGMCLTGNFALALMVDPWVMAPVLSQPSLPFGINKETRRALHVSDDDLVTIKTRAVQEGQCVLGLRFTGDRMSPPERFERLRDELGENFEGIEIDSSKGNPDGIRRMAHSVVTEDLVDEDGHPTQAALQRVISFFHENLDTP